MLSCEKKLNDHSNWPPQPCIKNTLIHNQRYIGAWIKRVDDDLSQTIKVINVTGQYYYGFTQSGKPLIIDITTDQILEIFMDECDLCHRLTPVQNLSKFNHYDDEIMDEVTEILCPSCNEWH